MLQVVKNAKPKSSSEQFGEIFGKSASTGLESFLSARKERNKKQEDQEELKKANESIKKNYGIELSGVKDPEMRKLLISESLKGQNQQKKYDIDNDKVIRDKVEPLKAAKDALNQMRIIRDKGNLGIGASKIGYFGGETAKDIGEYQTLGNSLIQYATNIPIRNRIEFEKLAGHLGDPNITDQEAEGILEGMERIINNSLSQYGVESPTHKTKSGSSNKISLQEIWE